MTIPKACPNPECGEPCELKQINHGPWQIICNRASCGYHGPIRESKAEAIRLHNLVAAHTGEAAAWMVERADGAPGGKDLYFGEPDASQIQWAEIHGHKIIRLFAAPAEAAPVGISEPREGV